MRQLRLIIIITNIVLLVGIPQLAFAHELEQNNGISAVLHIQPDDNPIAGRKTILNISYGDSAKKFTLENCDCKISLVRNEKVLTTVKATPAHLHSTLESSAEIVFPSPGEYEIRASGRSNNNTFPDFEIEFPVKISKNIKKDTINDGYKVLIFAAGTLLIVIFAAFTYIKNGKRYNKSTR